MADRPRKRNKSRDKQDDSGQGGLNFVDRSGKIHKIGDKPLRRDPRDAGPKPTGPSAPAAAPSDLGDLFIPYQPKSRPTKNPVVPVPTPQARAAGESEPYGRRDQRGGSSERGGATGGRGGKPNRSGGRDDRGAAARGPRDNRPKREARPGRDGGDFRGSRGGKPDRVGKPDRGTQSGRSFEAKSGQGGEPRIVKANIDKNRKGFGFLIFEDRKIEDAFIPPREAENFFHGDRVEVQLGPKGDIQDVRVIQHRFRELVGRYSPHPTKGGFIVYERKRAREEVYSPEGTTKAQEGDWVKAKLEFHEDGPFPVTATITDIYGPELPPSADIDMVAAEYNLIEEHPEAAVKQAQSFKLDVAELDFKHRRDLRDVPFITIDGETARDFDDAVYVERTPKGHLLWVAIADVSHYVTVGTPLDDDARSRGTSVYFPERAFHMLPRALSENLCSLRPDEPRLGMVAKMEFDGVGKRISTEIMEALIESKRRATYNEIQAEWEQNPDNRDWEYAPHFELYKKLRKARTARGSIDFDLPEAELVVLPTGEPVSITQRNRVDAHRLIEEFMIVANESVTEWMLERDWPFLYRIHEEPSEQSIDKFQRLASNVGMPIEFDKESLSASLADLVVRLEGHPAQTLLNISLLRSMKQAVYSSVHHGHFGLASAAYTHFTSPIRRYPDLVVHRLIRHALRVQTGREAKFKGDERERLETELTDISEHCSYRERLASDAERESIKLKQVRLIREKLGEELDGKVNGLTETGLFILLDQPYVEGMVTRDSLQDDRYQFDEDRMIYYGARTRRTFHIGDRVKIRVAAANIDLRTVDFEMLEGGTTASGEELAAIRQGASEAQRERGSERGGRGGGRGGKRGGENREWNGRGGDSRGGAADSRGRSSKRGPKTFDDRGGYSRDRDGGRPTTSGGPKITPRGAGTAPVGSRDSRGGSRDARGGGRDDRGGARNDRGGAGKKGGFGKKKHRGKR